jgi:nucleotide-binding universal stress UspA family protein
MFSSVVVGVKELEAGRDALRLAQALTSATGTLTLAHVQVVAPKPAPDSGAAGLLMLGSHKHGPIGRVLRHGIPQRLADEPPCPLLVVE